MKKQQPVANIIDTLPCFLVWPVRDLNGGNGGGGGGGEEGLSVISQRCEPSSHLM